MANIKVIFGSTTGNTENAAELIAAELGGEAINVTDAVAKDFDADLLVFGSSTWGIGELQDDWISAIGILDKVDLKGKKVALFGDGDQIGFSDTFIDAVGTLYQKVKELGAEVIGYWDADAYNHSGSTAEIDGKFAGLALDDDNEPDLTSERIKKWCAQLKSEAGF